MGAVAAIILVIICVVSSRNSYVYAAIIGIMYLIGIVLFIMGCVTGFGYAIGGGILSILIAYFLTYVVSAGEISIFKLIDYLRNGENTREFYPASQKAVDARYEHLEEIRKHSKERAGNKSIPTYDDLRKFHGWDIPKTPKEFTDKVYKSYGRTRVPYGEGSEMCKKYAKVLMDDYSSEFYDTTVHYKKERDWYIILAQIGKRKYEARKKKMEREIEYAKYARFRDAEMVYGFRLPRTPLDFVKEYAYMKKDAKICEIYRRSGEVIMEDENSPFYPDSPYYKGKEPAYENKEQFIEACVKWSVEQVKKEREAERIKAEKRKDEELRRAIESYK